ncbi:hypothetical protein [Methylorubrum extorquens]|uniref:hypothetical protein n=1 Tax=Methylorubrum extorquens TaxID=408 RepID=UPI00209E22C5|nr:hypothetical protein [Methylorubrum extorquens]MCP1540100.1 putative ATP-dependent protease [Methylorubrum extorquens]
MEQLAELVREYALIAVMNTASYTEDEGVLEDLQHDASVKAEEIIARGRQAMEEFVDVQRNI